jgi:hypothetical protein
MHCNDPSQLEAIADELQGAIHTHVEILRKKLSEVPAAPRFYDPLWK